jgi:hypothetical protein
MIRLRFGGNGHTLGFNTGGINPPNPGTVTIYWKGAPEQEITDVSEFTANNTLQSQGFSDNSFSYPADPNVKMPTQGLVDKGNWMELNLPSSMQPGRHMMVWVWSFTNGPKFGTCFDVMIQSGLATNAAASSSGASISTPPESSSPAVSLGGTQMPIVPPLAASSTPGANGTSSTSSYTTTTVGASNSSATQEAKGIHNASAGSSVRPMWMWWVLADISHLRRFI